MRRDLSFSSLTGVLKRIALAQSTAKGTDRNQTLQLNETEVPDNWELNIRLTRKKRTSNQKKKTDVISLHQTFINQNRDKRTEYTSIRNPEFAKQRQD